MINILFICTLLEVVQSLDNCNELKHCNSCIDNVGISGNKCMWLVDSSNHLCVDYTTLLINICNNPQSLYFSYCPATYPIQDNPCSKANNPLPFGIVVNMVLFIFYTTNALNAAAFAFYKYRYENINPFLSFFIGFVLPYFCWFKN